MRKFITIETVKDEIVTLKVKGKDEAEIQENLLKYKYKRIISVSDQAPVNPNNNRASLGMQKRMHTYQKSHSRARILA